ncbi:MAG: hypothetical protein IT416_00765 [Candidatus Pacebacteria bacterium]|nr:hypothetical protein [Candidatus Paceibacterota bacterium]
MKKEIKIALNEEASRLVFLLSVLFDYLNPPEEPIVSEDEKELTFLVVKEIDDVLIRNAITQSIGAFVKSVSIAEKEATKE